MGYLTERVRAIVKDQYDASAKAARRGTVEDWSAYRHLVEWLDGAIMCWRPSRRPSES